MKDLGYSDGYKYSHDYPNHFAPQLYMPDALKDTRIWQPQHSPIEERQYQHMLQCWGDKYKNE